MSLVTSTTTTSTMSSASKKQTLMTLCCFLVSEQQLLEQICKSRIHYVPHLRLAIVCMSVCLLFRSRMIHIILFSQPQLFIYWIFAAFLGLLLLNVLQILKPSPCYLVDFCCVEGDPSTKATVENFALFLPKWKSVKQNNMFFQFKVFLRSGIGEEAYVPPILIDKAENVEMEDARAETQTLIGTSVERLLCKTGISPKEIDIVIVNSSLFNPVPSLTAFVVNRFKMRSNVRSFTLAGMGCSAGLISIDLAKDLLKVHRDSYALVVSTENITKSMYFGNDRSMMVSNSLFRVGCSAVLLSNKTTSRHTAKLQLMHCIRTHMGADQRAYECVHQMEDAEGKLGVSLQISLMEVAATALRANITRLAPSILPVGELVKVAASMMRKVMWEQVAGGKVYEPDFKKAIDLFCIHPGGRAVIDAIGKGLKLNELDVEPGKMALHGFGNTSSSGIWYAMAYCEAKGRLKKDRKVWQIALGSGFKCNSGVWKVLRDIKPWDGFGTNPWLPLIHRYPLSHSPTEEFQQAGMARLVGYIQSTRPDLMPPSWCSCSEAETSSGRASENKLPGEQQAAHASATATPATSPHQRSYEFSCTTARKHV